MIDPNMTTRTIAPTVPITLLEVRSSSADIFLITYDVSNDLSRRNLILISLINSWISSSVLFAYDDDAQTQLHMFV